MNSDLQMLKLMMLVIIYVFGIRYQQNFTASQPNETEYKFDGVLPDDINGYALVLTKKILSTSSDGQRFFDLM